MRILFICHGNICRSTMAEFVMKNLLEREGLYNKITAYSMATHTDEIGKPPYYQTLRVLRENGLKTYEHKATQVCAGDYEQYDMILCMDNENMQTLHKIFAGKDMKKVKFLLSYANENFGNPNVKHADLIIDDPYYTRNFEKCYADISKACKGLLEWLKNDLTK